MTTVWGWKVKSRCVFLLYSIYLCGVWAIRRIIMIIKTSMLKLCGHNKRGLIQSIFCRTKSRRIVSYIIGCMAVILLLFSVLNFLDLYLLRRKIYDPTLNPTLVPLENLPLKGIPRIPKIIHQTWKEASVPSQVTAWVKSWKKIHPDWEYWFWTDHGAREFIRKTFPKYLLMYDNYMQNIRRADAIRYFILYHFGGLYVDTDMEAIRPIDPLTYKYNCFLGQEPPEHGLLDTNSEHLAINAIMGCRPGHPFFKLVIDRLPDFSHMWDLLDSTGPHFLTNVWKEYSRRNKSDTHEEGVYLAPAEYFIPTTDPLKPFYFRPQCKKVEKLTRKQREACISLFINKLREKPAPYSFTVHHWIHTYLPTGQLIWYASTTPIKHLIPGAKIKFDHEYDDI